MLRRKVVIFGRSVPLAVIVAAVGMVAVAASFALRMQLSVGGTALAAPNLTKAQPWLCDFSPGPGNIGSCVNSADNLGVTATISGFNDGSVFRFVGTDIRNDEGTPVCPTVVTPPLDASYQLSTMGSAADGIAPAGSEHLYVMAAFVGLEPGETVDIIADVSWDFCP